MIKKLDRVSIHSLIVVLSAFGLFNLDSVGFAQFTTVDYARQIQPLFARHCYKCHGPDEAESSLRLDTRDGALAETDSGDHAIVPGDPEASVILDRIRTDDEYERMPPEGEGLTAAEVDLVEQWIRENATWSEHWAFRDLKTPEVPAVQHTSWVNNPIDAFVLRRLEAVDLAPAPPADKLSLLRRAYYDLIGLPPTQEQVAAFLADDSPEAFEKVVDELLASQQYGEKWARHWLDLVRYAETNGYERDSRKELIWKYRDYVIRSLNEDKPYDRFVLEQLAGDELADAGPDAIIATGFYRLGIWDDEPADRELARYDYLDDIVRTTGEGLLGMTIGCARCHDHKIDPILQKDYYSMLAFFSDISPHGAGSANHVPIAPDRDRAEFDARVAAKARQEQDWRESIDRFAADLVAAVRKQHPDVEVSLERKTPADGVLLPDATTKGHVWKYTEQRPPQHWLDIAFDDSGWQEGPSGFGREGTPGAVVRTPWHSNDIWLRTYFRLGEIPQRLTLKIHHDEDCEVYLNGQQIAQLAGYEREYQEIDVTEVALKALQTGRNTLAIHCRQTGGGQYIDAGLLADASDPLEALADQYGDDLLGAERVKAWREARNALAKSLTSKLEFQPEKAMAVAESGPQTTWILQRGLPAAKGDEVSPAFPEVLDPPAPEISAPEDRTTAGKRLALARWIVRPDNPLTARVIANRIWQFHFGRGIVRSSSDFGYQGTPPTHPELLDWLATDLVSHGWKLKRFHKLIMMSQTYQMSSQMNQTAYAQDPTNDLLWRFDLRRLTAEEIRDSILAMGGSLNPKMFGPPVYSPVSDEVLATASRPDAAWGKSPPEEAARRTIYVHVKRSLRPPMLVNFDAPDTDTSCAVRMTTTVPTQALGMLNSEFMSHQAELLAQRLQTEAGEDSLAQIKLAIRLVTGRQAETDELEADLAFLEALQNDEGLTAEKALQIYCLMMLNTNEFVYLD